MTTNILLKLRLNIDSPLAVPSAENYRPPCWPPTRDWPVVLDAAGEVVSRWGDAIWRLDPWAGKPLTLNFGDGPAQKHVASIEHANSNLLRSVVGWWLYGPNSARGCRGLKTRFDHIRKLFVLSTKENILASELSQYPHVADRIPNIFQPSRAGVLLALLHELYEQRDTLGFSLLDRAGLKRLAAAIPDHERHQTPYVPPRIWCYQITRLRECLEDFLAHKDQIEGCFRFCLAAYQHNSSNLEGNVRPPLFCSLQQPSYVADGRNTKQLYHEPFIDIARRFGIIDLLRRWLDESYTTISGVQLSHYLYFVSRVGLAYILNFSLMRVEEAWNLCTDCLHIEHDPQFGEIHILRGRTTKTMSDIEALWVTSPSVSIAVEAMRRVADLQVEGILPKEAGYELLNSSKRYLIDYRNKPWTRTFSKFKGVRRPSILSYSQLIHLRTKLFDPEQLRITNEDFELARLVTPTLTDEFSVGKIWPLAWHQLRRTGAVNMLASGLVSDASLQFQLKHTARAMSLYYGQNYSRVRMEEKAHAYYVLTMYETLGKQLQQLTSNRFVSPHGEKRKIEIVRLISAVDTRNVIKLAKQGIMAHRPILLGICTNRTPCPYGGIDNIAHCGGGDSPGEPKPCAHVLYDPEQLSTVEMLEIVLEERLITASEDSPLRASLEAQKRSVENFRNVIQKT
ncbi:hypothetical protein [Rheinheimera baltica]|uniref:hypothetical protein n=1 Tax=Rheinheimera baltica TaxID=67576 RepID=UPI00048410E1|nr:hypothetical protein [Rheinheimera baltica]